MTDAPLEFLFGLLLLLFLGLILVLRQRASRKRRMPASGAGTEQLVDADGAQGVAPPAGVALLDLCGLENVTVGDLMIPRSEVIGIDLEDDLDEILETIYTSVHTRLPVYRRDLNDILGIFHMRNAARLLTMDEVTKDALLRLAQPAYFVPESTPLYTQMVKFQKNKRRLALVVDEYGDVQGIITLDDILEEIVGAFTANAPAEETDDIHPQNDGSYLIDGATPIREINRALGWHLPTDGPRTLNGLLTELLESIPENNVGVRLPSHYAEILQVKDNMIKTVRMRPTAVLGEHSLDSQGSLFT